MSMLPSVRHLCCAVLILGCCYAESRDAKAIQTVSDEIARGIWKHANSVMSMAFSQKTSDARYIGGATMLNREQFLKAVRQEAERALPPVRVSIKLVRLRVQGDSATATWSEVTEYFLADAQGSKHRFRGSQDYHLQLVRERREVEDRFTHTTRRKERRKRLTVSL